MRQAARVERGRPVGIVLPASPERATRANVGVLGRPRAEGGIR